MSDRPQSEIDAEMDLRAEYAKLRLGTAALGGVGQPGGHGGLPLAPGMDRLIALRHASKRPEGPLHVSFVGSTGRTGLHVFPRHGVAYDWRGMHGMHAQIYVRPGIDARDAIASIFKESDLTLGYPLLLDVDLQTAAYITSVTPFTPWPIEPGSQTWREHFEQ